MTTTTIANWDAIRVGDELPPLVKTPTPMRLFMFSAVTWNRHLIHYNTEFAVSDGLQNVAVHRALLGGFLAQLLSDWLGDAGRLVTLDWSVRGNAAINEPVTCKGTVKDKRIDEGRRLVDCDVLVENHTGNVIVPGTAVVELHR